MVKSAEPPKGLASCQGAADRWILMACWPPKLASSASSWPVRSHLKKEGGQFLKNILEIDV